MTRLCGALALAASLLAGCDRTVSQRGDGGSPGSALAPGAMTVGTGARPTKLSTSKNDGVVRFVAMGDAGTGSKLQATVGSTLARKCAADGCDFVILLGDNFYPSGVVATDDPQWQDKFEIPYKDVNVPFYAVLGNHDYGADGAGYQWERGLVQVAYGETSPKWNMPYTHYTWIEEHVGFVALDTNSIAWGNTDYGDQGEWVGPAMTVLNTSWVIVLGHHPYLSNGPHGNAGTYDGVPFVPVANGANVKEFLDSHVCGAVDVYLSGHDHSRQWLRRSADCAMEMLVSGAGAKTTHLPGDNPAHYQSDEEGFLYVVIQGNTFTGQFINADGSVGFERTFARH